MRIMSYFFGQMRFQSTPSTRRVTIQPLFVPPIKIISIHTLHTEGDHTIPYAGAQIDISIHTLHTEGDIPSSSASQMMRPFQSTPSTRRVTGALATLCNPARISIHTLHTEGDTRSKKVFDKACDFNPHPPHGG